MKILVTGASGQFGKAAIQHLLKIVDPSTIYALVRSETKASELNGGINILIGDYDKPDSLIDAFSKVDKILFVSSNDISARQKQHENVVNAAKIAQVKHIVYTGVVSDNIGGNSPIEFVERVHRETEKLLKTSGLSHTIMGNSLYTDIIPVFVGDQMIATQTILFPAGGGKTGFATREDMAEAAVTVLLDTTSQYENRFIDITGVESITWEVIAATVSEITGIKINYVSPEPAAYKQILDVAQLPEEIIAMLSGFGEAIEKGYFEKITEDLENILGRKPTTIYDYLKGIYA